MYVVINAIQLAGVVVGFLTIIVVALQKASENQKVLLLASNCAFLSILSYTLEINSRSLNAMVMALKFGYLGKCYVLLLFLLFMAAYCEVSLPKKIFRFFLIFNTVMLAVIVTCEHHTLYYRNLHIAYDGLFPHAAFEKGICYWMFMAVMLLLVVWYLVLSLMELKKRVGQERKRLMLLSLAGIVPSFMLVVYLTGILDVFDPVPIGIVISCTLLTFNVVKFGLLDTMELAKDKVIESTKEGLIVIDPNYHLLYVNKVAQLIFPDVEDPRKGEQRLRQIFGGQQEESVIEYNGRNYEIRISEIAEDASGEHIRGYLAWILDMTFVNRYTEEMIRMRQEAEKANLAKSSFLAHMSHEIRTPMNAIVGFSDLCLRENPQGEIGDYVENIKISAETLLNLINDVLDISKIESGKMELVELEYQTKAVMKEVVLGIGQQAQAKGLTLRYMLESGLPSALYGDKMRVKEIVTNLLSNAVKYTNEGTILLKIKEIERLGEKILLEIIVKDTGIGIREEDKDRLFQKFEQFDTVKNYSKEGSGLGLAIVKNLAELMHGSVEVESTYGKGSTFRVRVWQKIVDRTPVGECRGTNLEEIGLRKETRKEKYNIRFPGTSVLVVDDNEVNLKVAYGLLKLYGIRTDLVQSGKECLKAVSSQKYDLVFMDLMMPEMDGVATLHSMKYEKYGGEVPVIALTANTLVGVKEEVLAEGFDDFLGKPIELAELEKTLESFLKEKCERDYKEEETAENGRKKVGYEILGGAGIRAEEGETFCGGADGYREILQIFAENAPKQQQTLSETLQKKDMDRYGISVHALKSSAASIGAKQLSEMAKEHEQAVKEGDFRYPEQHFKMLLQIYEDVVKAIREFLQSV